MEESELEALVKKAQGGDKRAQNALLLEHQAFLRKVAHTARMRGLQSPQISTSVIMQQTSMKVIQELASHEWKDTKNFENWIRLKTRGTASDLRKWETAQKRGGKEKNQNADSTKDPESKLDTTLLLEAKAELQTISWVAKSVLSVDAARVMELITQGWDYEAIAEVMEKSPDAIRKMAERAVEKIVPELQEPTKPRPRGLLGYMDKLNDGVDGKDIRSLPNPRT